MAVKSVTLAGVEAHRAFPIRQQQEPRPPEKIAESILKEIEGFVIDETSILLVERTYLAIAEYKNENPLSQEKRKKREVMHQAKQSLLDLVRARGYVFGRDEFISPLFIKIDEAANDRVTQLKLDEKKLLISECRRDLDLTELSASEIEMIYTQCSEEKGVIRSIERLLKEMIEKADIPEMQKPLFEFRINHTAREGLCAEWEGSHFCIAYSFFDLLRSLELVSGDYLDGKKTFALELNQLKAIKERLENIDRWHDDFELILGDLLSTNAETTRTFYGTARKSIVEVMRSPVGLSKEAILKLRDFREGSIILFNQIGLNLETHPERDVYKVLFERFYALEGMLASNGRDPKTFMVTDPYRSILNVSQIMLICPHLNKQLVLQKKALSFCGCRTWTEALDVLRALQVENELELYKQTKALDLNEIYNILGSEERRPFLPYLAEQVHQLGSIAEIEEFALRQCCQLLTERTGLFLKKAHLFRVEERMKDHLYRGEKTALYERGVRHTNIQSLFLSLRSSPLVRGAIEAHPDYEASLSTLEREFLRRMNTYHAMPATGFYGREVFNQAIEYVENYVAKIVFSEESKVGPAEVARSLDVIVGICGPDLQYCNEGFCGRIQEVLQSLQGNGIKSGLKQSIEDVLRNTVYERFDQLIAGNTQSSHLVTARSEALKFLGIEAPGVEKELELLSHHARTLVDHTLLEVTPVRIYEIAYKYIKDEFWRLNVEGDDEKVYQLLDSLGFEGGRAAADAQFRVNGERTNRWQYAFFQQALPKYLIGFLLREHHLFVHRPSREISAKKEGRALILQVARPVMAAPALPPRAVAVQGGGAQAAGPALAAPAYPARAAAAAPVRALQPDLEERQRRIGQQTTSTIPSFTTGTS